ncbi:MAG TPA: helix-turn-helix domain-containing protein, partial [Spirochaetota bacterium]|nr:helix-turn-helix domain-containing protein [Spirochaetota bacterium]
PELSLPMLAEKLNVPVHHLSQVINMRGMNFYEYINRYRFEFAKEMIRTVEDPVNIARIAFDSGFNSLSAFNAVFRKFGNMTPSEWKNMIRKKNQS